MPKIDELIEQLAFGVETGKVTSCLGLYLGPDVVYLSETHVDGGKLVVTTWSASRSPPTAKAGSTATMNTDFLADPAKIGA